MRNIKWGMVNKILLIVLPFVMRTILIKHMGSEFAGLSSLFTSILQVLNLAELGVGSAITFSLYKPLAENDTETIRATMALYKKVYRIIGLIILILGLIILPFLSFFIKGNVPNGINIYILFSLYLLNTTLTYFLFAYKTILLEANQRNDIISNVNTVLYIAQFVYQVFVIINFKNYYLYIAVLPIVTIINNILGALYAKKMYPEYYCEGQLSKEKKSNIKKRVYGLMIQKICATTRNSLDSIFISSFFGLSIVAIYNNYYMISTAIISLLSVFTTSMVSSIGNSVATEQEEKNFKDMNKFNFIYMWISGWCTICLLCLYQPFMKLWLGEDYMFEFVTVILFCVYFYSLKMGDILSSYNQGAGLWWEGKYRALAETVLNVVLNFVLGKLLGVNGIILGTLISLLLINFGYGSTIIFKYYFKNSKITEYFRKHLLYFIVTLIISVVTYLVTMLVNINVYADVAIIGIICVILPNILYFILYRKYYLFDEAVGFVKGIVKRK